MEAFCEKISNSSKIIEYSVVAGSVWSINTRPVLSWRKLRLPDSDGRVCTTAPWLISNSLTALKPLTVGEMYNLPSGYSMLHNYGYSLPIKIAEGE